VRAKVTPGHPDNWPRKLARKHPDLADALAALWAVTDEMNFRFAYREFIAEREEMQRRALDGAVITAEEGGEIIGELSAALAVLAGESLKPCAHGCPGHLGEKASAAFDAALKAWHAIQEGNRAAAARIADLECGLADQGRIYFLHGPPGTHDEQAIRAMRRHGQREKELARLAKLDALLASEDAPEGLVRAVQSTWVSDLLSTARQRASLAAHAWLWLREHLK
jgi:hypothetical protein